MKISRGLITVVHSLAVLTISVSGLQLMDVYAQSQLVQTVRETKRAKSQPLSSLLQNRIAPAAANESGITENKVRLLPITNEGNNSKPAAISAPDGGSGALDIATSASFSGVGWDRKYRVRVSPPDTNGAVGADDFVQWVNQAYGIFDKKTRNLKSIIDPGSGEALQTIWDGNLLWQGFGGKCEFSNDGDPIVLHDKLANPARWVMSQFAHSKPPGPPYSQCVAVSVTDDAAGQYFLYEFQFNNFNDYGKFAIWPDGYYASFNMFEDDGDNSDFLGSKVCAFDRSQMLQGGAASLQCVNLYQPQYSGVLPADFDGAGSSLPPSGSPELFLALDVKKNLDLWKFKVDWSDASKSQFSLDPVQIPVAAFEFPCVQGGYEVPCVSQPGSQTQRLEVLGDRLMYRLSYRNLGTRDALLVNHTVSVGKTTGIRWYEIGDPFHTPTVRQQGTFAPNDGLFRWMGSMAMDKRGNILLEYSVSGDKAYPSVRYTGRESGDALGSMRLEKEAMPGAGSQINTDVHWVTDRWGDYSSVSVDPNDDCTFWLTNQYQAKTGTYNWNTVIDSMKYPNCK